MTYPLSDPVFLIDPATGLAANSAGAGPVGSVALSQSVEDV